MPSEPLCGIFTPFRGPGVSEKRRCLDVGGQQGSRPASTTVRSGRKGADSRRRAGFMSATLFSSASAVGFSTAVRCPGGTSSERQSGPTTKTVARESPHSVRSNSPGRSGCGPSAAHCRNRTGRFLHARHIAEKRLRAVPVRNRMPAFMLGTESQTGSFVRHPIAVVPSFRLPGGSTEKRMPRNSRPPRPHPSGCGAFRTAAFVRWAGKQALVALGLRPGRSGFGTGGSRPRCVTFIYYVSKPLTMHCERLSIFAWRVLRPCPNITVY